MRHNNMPDTLPARGAVNHGAFQCILRNGLQPGIEHHKGKGRRMPDTIDNQCQPGERWRGFQ